LYSGFWTRLWFAMTVSELALMVAYFLYISLSGGTRLGSRLSVFRHASSRGQDGPALSPSMTYELLFGSYSEQLCKPEQPPIVAHEKPRQSKS
jgi:hypothetical protein